MKSYMATNASDLLPQIDRSALPAHVAIIMDGNGRWARKRGLPRVAGHRAGISAVREVVEGSAELGIPVLTLYAFSVENWKRPRSEVSTLMQLLKEYLNKELENIHQNNIRFRTIGRTDELDVSVQAELDKAITKTSRNSGMIFNVALNYGGRAEIVDAVNRLLRNGGKAAADHGGITEEHFAQYLYEAIIAYQKRERRYGGLEPAQMTIEH